MRLLPFLIFLILSGCTAAQPVIVDCPKPSIPPAPQYPAASLKPGDSPATVAKAYVASLGMCLDDNANLRRVCGVYE